MNRQPLDEARRRLIRDILASGIEIDLAADALFEARPKTIHVEGELDTEEGFLSYVIDGDVGEETVIGDGPFSLEAPSGAEVPSITVRVEADPDAELLEYIDEDFEGDPEFWAEETGIYEELEDVVLGEVGMGYNVDSRDVEWESTDPPFVLNMTIHFSESDEDGLPSEED